MREAEDRRRIQLEREQAQLRMSIDLERMAAERADILAGSTRRQLPFEHAADEGTGRSRTQLISQLTEEEVPPTEEQPPPQEVPPPPTEEQPPAQEVPPTEVPPTEEQPAAQEQPGGHDEGAEGQHAAEGQGAGEAEQPAVEDQPAAPEQPAAQQPPAGPFDWRQDGYFPSAPFGGGPLLADWCCWRPAHISRHIWDGTAVIKLIDHNI